MKTLAIAFVSSLVLATSASALTVEWRGTGSIKSVTSACAPHGWSAGNDFRIRMRPSNLGDNGTNTRLSLFFGTFAMGYNFASDPSKNSYTTGTGGSVGPGAYMFGTDPEIKILKQKPKTIKDNSKYVYFEISMKNFNDLAGCTVVFNASGVLKKY